MCGICGMLGVSDKSVLERMMNVIVHRGPDDSGMYVDDHCAIGNRRLSIIDLGGGHQPMHNEDETIFVVFNGEIYNFIKLREELEKKGHRFHTNCDTEILVHLYEDYGTEMLSKLDGMFGFCIWDSKNKIAFLARDPLGIKPLHYAKIDGGLVFGSEVKSLLEFKGFEKKLNKEGVWAFLNQGYIPSDQTMFEGIFRLRAGHYLLWNGNSGAFRVKRFWDIRLGHEEGSVEFHTKTVRALLEKAVGKRLHADVPMGFFFSGGSDSLSIVALARKLRPHDKFETFTLFDEKSPASLSEAKTAKEMAAKYEMDHHEYPLDYNDVSLYDKAIWHNDEPRSNMLYNYLLSLKANKYVKVILTGVGGDELFAGYNRNRLVWKLRFVPLVVPRWTGRLIPLQGDLKRRVTQLASTSKDRKQFYINFMPTGPLRDSEVEMWSDGGDLTPHIYNEFIGEEGSISEAYLKTQLLTYLPQSLLHVLDRETMACSMEGRVPLCDVNLTEHAFRVPYRLKVKSFKHIFNLAVKDIVPAEIFKRKKGAFGGEPGRWIAGGIGDILKQRLEKVQAPFVSQDFVNKLVAKPEKTQREYDHLWNLLAYESWFRIYMLGDKIGV